MGTTKLDLYKPAGTENVNIDQFNSNWDIVDAAMGITECTSATRPASPFPDQAIYESDTKRILIWETADWVVAYDPASSIGVWTSYTPTLAGFTASSSTFRWRRERDLIRIRFVFTVSSAAVNNPQFSLPVPAVAAPSTFAIHNGVLSAITAGGATASTGILVYPNTDVNNVLMYGAAYLALSSSQWPSGIIVSGEMTFEPAS